MPALIGQSGFITMKRQSAKGDDAKEQTMSSGVVQDIVGAI
jgi:hypothetical protein